MAHLGFELRARQQTTLTPRLQQSVKLLQMSAQEFTHELQQALAKNPFLEEDDGPDVEDPGTPPSLVSESPFDRSAETGASGEAGDPGELASSLREETAALADTDTFGDALPDSSGDNGEYRGHGGGDSEAGDVGEWIHDSPALRDHLRMELCSYRLEPRDRAIVEIAIEGLDEDGYLRDDLGELVAALQLDPPACEEELSAAIKLVQQLDAPGIGARDLSECLRLQVRALPPETVGRAVALRLTDGHLERLARREYAELQRALGCDEDAIRIAHQLLRQLDPKPGLRYGRSEPRFVVPDVIVRKFRGRWIVVTNPAVMPKARLHRAYADMFRRARCSDRAPMAQELQEARWLIRNVEQRFSTILRVAEAIVARQRTFFDYGEVALKPLVLREVADELGLHESTVSRATGNKYMATPRGIFEFKHFFSRELATETGGSCSAAAVRALLREMIAGENRREPLSDVVLTRMLAQQGVIVARRTVAKYRGLMKVPPAELRRRV